VQPSSIWTWLLLSGACTEPAPELAFAPAGPEAAPDPSTWGPFPVGVATLWLTDPDRIEDDGEPRTIPVEVWYPAASAEGELRSYSLAELVPPERLEQDGITAEELGQVESLSHSDAEPDTWHGPYPLLIFSHGNGGLRIQSNFFTEVLASHGYVVAAPDHVGNTLYDFLVPGANQDTSMYRAMYDRPYDVDLVVERLLGAETPAPVSDRLGVAGHSFGTWTAIRAMGLDPRFEIAVVHAPVDPVYALLGTGIEPAWLEGAVVLQAGDDDQLLDYEDNAVVAFESLGDEAILATYHGAGHFTFSDLCVLDLGPVEDMVHDSVGDVLEDGCGPQNMPPEVAFPAIRQHGIGALNAVLRDSPGSESWLVGDGEWVEVEGGL